MLIDRYLPTYDVTEVCETSLHAPPDVTYAAIRETRCRVGDRLGRPLLAERRAAFPVVSEAGV